jgi:hypothetical protein
MNNWTLADRIEKASEMAKYTGKHFVAMQATSFLQSGMIVKADKLLKRYGF